MIGPPRFQLLWGSYGGSYSTPISRGDGSGGVKLTVTRSHFATAQSSAAPVNSDVLTFILFSRVSRIRPRLTGQKEGWAFVAARPGLGLSDYAHTIGLHDIAGDVAVVLQGQQVASIGVGETADQSQQIGVCRQCGIAGVRVGIGNGFSLGFVHDRFSSAAPANRGLAVIRSLAAAGLLQRNGGRPCRESA